ncbi:hypothetical protein ACEWY4_019239 [Coilia grayii]|uniref:TNFR-Cys domain-containing protein n=1 Tax=Coilia grayii TaxID=363190 RepID=A0ABD1JFR3_9TELE
MRVTFTTSWIFQGWIKNIIVILCIHVVYSKPCKPNQYLSKDKRCCSKCEPGMYMFASCTANSETKCRPCGDNEYQPDWNNDTKCMPQRFCDKVKGFSQDRPQNPKAAVPCPCMKGFRCSLTNCEWCEPIPPCPPGQGFSTDESSQGSCKSCPEGYFSDNTSTDPCRPWVNCKDFGKLELKPGNAKNNAVCGPAVLISSTSGVVVAILSVIMVVSLVILTLFCYKDKMKLLSVNVRSCVQNLKRSRIQQETMAPPYNGPQHCTYEITRLLRPDESTTLCPSTVLTISGEEESVSATPASLSPVAVEDAPTTPSKDSTTSEGSTVEGEGAVVEGATLPLSGNPSSSSGSGSGSCICVITMKEPVELGENEDYSQVVADGPSGVCSCGGAEREDREEERDSGPTRDKAVEGAAGGVEVRSLGDVGLSRGPEESPLCQNCCPEAGLLGCADCTDLGASQDLYLDYSSLPGKEAMSEARGRGDPSCEGPQGTMALRHMPNEAHSSRTDAQAHGPTTTLSSISSKEQALSLSCSADLKLSETDVDPDCPAHCSETALTSGQVSGNNNTTFISNGQVMNFSGEVIVVYVSQTSQGSCGGETSEPSSCPVQEESNTNHEGSNTPSTPKSPSGARAPSTPQDRNIPVQEMARRWPGVVK